MLQVSGCYNNLFDMVSNSSRIWQLSRSKEIKSKLGDGLWRRDHDCLSDCLDCPTKRGEEVHLDKKWNFVKPLSEGKFKVWSFVLGVIGPIFRLHGPLDSKMVFEFIVKSKEINKVILCLKEPMLRNLWAMCYCQGRNNCLRRAPLLKVGFVP
jgi:hypothetical protein